MGTSLGQTTRSSEEICLFPFSLQPGPIHSNSMLPGCICRGSGIRYMHMPLPRFPKKSARIEAPSVKSCWVSSVGSISYDAPRNDRRNARNARNARRNDTTNRGGKPSWKTYQDYPVSVTWLDYPPLLSGISIRPIGRSRDEDDIRPASTSPESTHLPVPPGSDLGWPAVVRQGRYCWTNAVQHPQALRTSQSPPGRARCLCHRPSASKGQRSCKLLAASI